MPPVAEHGRGLAERHRIGRQPAQARVHGSGVGGRRWQDGQLGQLRLVVLLGEFAQVQRVALRVPPHGLGQFGGYVRSHAAQHLFGGVAVQSVEGDRVHVRCVTLPALERDVIGGPEWAGGQHHEQPLGLGPGQHGQQRLDRLRIGPLQVVDRHEHRPVR